MNLTKSQYHFRGQKGIYAKCGVSLTFALTQLVGQPMWRRRGCGGWKKYKKPLRFTSTLKCRCICWEEKEAEPQNAETSIG
jgi:hypothetical protein